MTSRTRTTIVAAACLFISMTACVLLLHHIDQIRPPASAEDALYINSPKFIKRASLGFDGLMACVYWTRAVQYFGSRHARHETTYNELAPLLEIATALDPHMIPVYQFGANFLAPVPPNGAGEPVRAVALMQYGIRNNPYNWRLYYDLGFVYYTELHDYKKAAEVFELGSRAPDANPFMNLLAAQMAEHAQDYSTARMLWMATYESSTQTDIRQNALEHLRCIKVDEEVTSLQDAVNRFTQQAGRAPASFWELAAAEHLPGIPVDPDGHPFELSVDGQVLVQYPDDFPFITKGVPPGYKRSGLAKFHNKDQ